MEFLEAGNEQVEKFQPYSIESLTRFAQSAFGGGTS